MLTVAISAAATLVALACTVSIGDRWLARRKAHDLAWMVAFAFFTLASAALWLGVATGWTPASFRVFYLFGAVLNVPWLALGSWFVVLRPKRGATILVVFAIVSAFLAGVLFVIPMRTSVPTLGLPEGRNLFGLFPRIVAAASSGVGAMVVIGLATWSATRALFQVIRHQPFAGGVSAARRATGNSAISTGTLVLAASGFLPGRIGAANAFAITLGVGVVLLFVGFLLATDSPGIVTRRSVLADAITF
jgi:hypothetical protein